MGGSELLAAYPDCREAVSWCELILNVPEEEDGLSGFDLMRRSHPPLNILEILRLIREAMCDPENVCMRGPKRIQAIHQTKLPSFCDYVRARMGYL